MPKIGVLGVGHLGKIHLKLLQEIDYFDVVGFYDPDKVKSSNISKEFGIKSFDTADLLIDEVEAVDIVTPTLNHYELAVKSIKKGKHVFVEKPVTTTVSEAKSLMELAQEAKVKVQVGHVERYNPAFKASLPYFKNPMFIETHRLAQFNARGTDVSVILDLMIHDIDVVLSLVKSNIRRISANGVSVVSETPDIANARIEFDNGCVANLTASRISMKNMRKTRFFQRDAYVAVDFYEKQVEVIKMEDVKGSVPPMALTIDLPSGKQKQIIFNNPQINDSNAIKEELSEFGNAILNNLPTNVTIEDGYYALHVAHQIIDKLKINSNYFDQEQ